MADSARFFLLYQVIENPVFRIQIAVDIHLADIVKQIEIKIGHLTFLQLFLENGFYFIDIGKIIAGKFIGEIKLFPRIFFQRAAQHCL